MSQNATYETYRALIKQGIEDRDWSKIEEAAGVMRLDFFRPEDMACNKKCGSDAPKS